MYDLLLVIVTSMLPVSELRGGIPLGLGLGLDPVIVIPIAIMFNSLVFFPIYFGSDFFYKKFLYKWKLVDRVIKRIHKKRDKIEKYGVIGLIFFVAIPLPFTGAWTASILAWLLQLDWKKSYIVILGGVIIAAAIVSAISLGIINGLL